MTKEEVQDLIDEVDENRDGKLNYREVIMIVLDQNLISWSSVVIV